MDLTIRPGAALQDATQVDTIVNQIKEDMRTLNDVITSTIPSGIQTKWAEELLSSWVHYYSSEIDSALEELAENATNLRVAVEKVLQYSNEEL